MLIYYFTIPWLLPASVVSSNEEECAAWVPNSRFLLGRTPKTAVQFLWPPSGNPRLPSCREVGSYPDRPIPGINENTWYSSYIEASDADWRGPKERTDLIAELLRRHVVGHSAAGILSRTHVVGLRVLLVRGAVPLPVLNASDLSLRSLVEIAWNWDIKVVWLPTVAWPRRR